MIHLLGRPVVSTSANVSGQPAPIVFSQITRDIREKVDYTVEYSRDVMVRPKPSTIIRLLDNGEFEVIRK
jgi:L-threonylcarbamoyladenylate synthase